MNWWLFLLGALLVIAAWNEEIWTTLWIDGHSGPLTNAHTSLTQRVLKFLSRGQRYRLLSITGPLVLISTVLFWTLLLWSGFAFLFSADPDALVATHTGRPASWQERVYFVSYAIFTFGNGDYSPRGTLWQWLAGLAGMSGLFLISLTVTYLLSVLSAAVNIRSFASQVQALGSTPEDFVINCWDGRSFRAVELQLLSLAEKLSTITERMAAYPLAHYYHAHAESRSLSRGLVIYDEALLLFMRGVVAEQRPAPAILQAARKTVSAFLESSHAEHIRTSEQVPSAPALDRLQKAGIPIVAPEQFASGVNRDEDRRRLLLGLLQLEGRDWPH